MDLPIQIDPRQIADFCRANHIIRLALFGSILTDRFGPDSDVDILVEFDPEQLPTLFEVVAMERELSVIMGRRADIRTPKDLSRYFRDEVMRTALVQYAA